MSQVKKYFVKLLEDFRFQELDEKFYPNQHTFNLMKGIPVPIDVGIIKNAEKSKIEIADIVRNMVLVVGADSDFKYAEHYKLFMFGLYKEHLIQNILADGQTFFDKEEYMKAAANFKALLSMQQENGSFYYYYGMATRGIYLNGGDEELVGTFKAEALKSFEKATLLSPELPQPYYFLGYSYLNMGMYMKAEITWKTFIQLVEDGEQKEEIRLRIQELKEPVEIEKGCNLVISGRFQEGFHKLHQYSQKEAYKDWWPLYFYSGIAAFELKDYENAITFLKKVLAIDTFNVDTMKLLVQLYEIIGDKENQEKYLKKIDLILNN